MPLANLVRTIKEAFANAGTVTRLGFGTILRDPSILAYPLLASIFVTLTYALVGGLVIKLWHSFEPKTAADIVGSAQQQIPHQLRDKVGIVTFYYFYTATVTAYFSCAASAAVWAKLEGHPTNVLHGLAMVTKHSVRIFRFAVLSVFFIPLAVVAQWRKLFHKPVDALGGALNLHIANMAPAILNERTGVLSTIRTTISTLGKAWHEGLVIKVGTWLVLLVLGLIGLLPKYIQHYHYGSNTARWVGWTATTVLLAVFFVVTKVISGVLLTTLYYQVKTEPQKYQ